MGRAARRGSLASRALGIIGAYIVFAIGTWGMLAGLSLVVESPLMLTSWIMLAAAACALALGSVAVVAWHSVNTP